MNITPEQIPDEVAEVVAKGMAVVDWGWLPPQSQERHLINARKALAAALPVLLGEPVGHVGKFAFDALNASRADEQNGFVELWMRPLSGACIALYTLPTPETPNE